MNIMDAVSQVDRTGTKTTIVPLKEEKDTTWQDSILQMCIDGLVDNNMPQPEVVVNKWYNKTNICIFTTFQFPVQDESVLKRKNTFSKVNKE